MTRSTLNAASAAPYPAGANGGRAPERAVRRQRVSRRVGLLAGRVKKLLLILGVPRFRSGLRAGVAASTEQLNVPFVGKFATVVDVGANRGQFALLARHRFPGARLYCFEPLDEPRRRLTSVLAGDANAQIFGMALSTEAGEMAMNVSASDDSSSLLAMTHEQTALFPGTETVGKVGVAVARLDDVLGDEALDAPCLLKIDVQGAELDVLRGATGILDRIDEMLVECSFVELYSGQPLADEVISFLRTQDFSLNGVYSPTYDGAGRCIQADLLFGRVALPTAVGGY